jgi:histone chaperone ASF1
LKENPPEKPEISKIERNILNDKPRVTLFQIEWDAPISLDTAETDMITENDINENEVLLDDDMNEEIVEDDEEDDDLVETPQEEEIASNDEIEEEGEAEEKKGIDTDF